MNAKQQEQLNKINELARSLDITINTKEYVSQFTQLDTVCCKGHTRMISCKSFQKAPECPTCKKRPELQDRNRVKSRVVCIYNGCTTRPSYNTEGEKFGMYCRNHKLENMIDIVSKRCNYEGCIKSPIYGLSGTKPSRCGMHRENDMLDLSHPICKLCNKRATYKLDTDKKATLCCDHKTNNSICVSQKLCLSEGCSKIPAFNYSSEIKGLYCGVHKLEGMMNVKKRTCIHDGCIISANYNYINEKIGIYCKTHKLEEMENVTSKKCQHEGCHVQPIYNLHTEKRGKFCKEHKLVGMIDVVNKKCKIDSCFKNSIFRNFCLDHCPYDLNQKCKYCDLDEHSTFVCKNCMTVQNKKEWMVVRKIRARIETPFIYNSSSMFTRDCSKRRPDIYFELMKHCVIVEIDENQHKSYKDLCECSRINEIVNGIGGKTVIIIRFNPDNIKHKTQKIEVTLKDRIELLVKIIKEELIASYDVFCVKLVQLYFDDSLEKYEPVKTEYITDKVCI